LTDRSEHRPPEHDPERPLSSEEQKFFGGDRDRDGDRDQDIDRDQEVREEMRREDEASYEAGAAASAPPREESASPAAGERDREQNRDDDVALRRRDEGPGGSQEDRTTTRESTPLFTPDDAESLRTRWDGIQTRFVDEPRDAVEKADALVGDVMQRLTDGFSAERSRLEREWDRGDRVSTEDLRVALKRYRSFFDRLLSV
jgi:hypothetical protein